MNILPKKRWHVRTKDNIARVRRDEAEAAEKEKQEQLRIETADREARLNVLKLKSKQKLSEHDIVIAPPEKQQSKAEHINLFQNLDQAVQTTNKEHDIEVKNKKEEYEKKIGYLTYLGQDTNEALKKKNWYEVLPESSSSRSSEIKDTYEKLVLKDPDGKPKVRAPDEKDGEVDYKSKKRHDPINGFIKYCYGDKFKKIKSAKQDDREKSKEKLVSNGKISKKHKKDDKQMNLQKLREARLKREQAEKMRTADFLAGLNGDKNDKERTPAPRIKPKYNSQFNPDLARQNYY